MAVVAEIEVSLIEASSTNCGLYQENIRKKFSVFLLIEVILIHLININETRQIFRLIYLVGSLYRSCEAVCSAVSVVVVVVSQFSLATLEPTHHQRALEGR